MAEHFASRFGVVNTEPMEPFDFSSAGRIAFGAGVRRQVPGWVAARAKRALVVTGKSFERHAWLFRELRELGVEVTHTRALGEPTIEDAEQAVALGRAQEVGAVVAVGGGSALDLGKAVAALIPNPGEPMDYLEVVGRGLPLAAPSLPLVAVPTTSGTGSEVTKNAVLSASAERVKVSLRGPTLLPALAVVDPELTLGLPRNVTANTGSDALVQVIEPFLSCASNPLTDALCREGIRRGARSLLRAVEDGADLDARTDLALTSLCGGLALANAKLGAVHGFAAPIGGMFAAPHGAITAALLGPTLAVNLAALESRAPESPVLARFDELAQLLTGQHSARAADAIRFCQELRTAIGISGLGAYGVTAAHLPLIAEKAARASSMKGNPLPLEREELLRILEASL